MSNALIPINDVKTMALSVAKSGLFPNINTEEKAMSLMLLCQATGLHPMLAVSRYHIIQGRPSMRSDAMLAAFQDAGGKIQWLERTDEACEAEFSHPSGGTLKVRWTIAMAKTAGLTGKDTWKQYPRAMLSARVVSEGIRYVYPSITEGMYTPEEVGDFAPTVAHVAPAPRTIDIKDVTPVAKPEPAPLPPHNPVTGEITPPPDAALLLSDAQFNAIRKLFKTKEDYRAAFIGALPNEKFMPSKMLSPEQADKIINWTPRPFSDADNARVSMIMELQEIRERDIARFDVQMSIVCDGMGWGNIDSVDTAHLAALLNNTKQEV